MLQHLNDEPVNIFPRAAKVIDYFKRRLPAGRTYVPEMMPGDILDADLCVVTELAEQRVEERNVVEYIADYAKDYKAFEERALAHKCVSEFVTAEALRLELESKLAHLSLADRVAVPLYVKLGSSEDSMLRVDFHRRVVEFVSERPESKYYELTAPAWQIDKVLARALTWKNSR